MPDDPSRPKVPRPRGGLLHIIDAAGYSAAGLRVLFGETAARLELGAAVLIGLAFLWRGAEPWHWLVAVGLLALVLVVETLNTAIEVLVDHVSPGWSKAAKDAKDLGSAAVGITQAVAILFVALVLLGAV